MRDMPSWKLCRDCGEALSKVELMTSDRCEKCQEAELERAIEKAREKLAA